MMQKHDLDLLVLSNPVSMRYAIDYDEYQLFQSRIPVATLVIANEAQDPGASAAAQTTLYGCAPVMIPQRPFVD